MQYVVYCFCVGVFIDIQNLYYLVCDLFECIVNFEMIL